MVAIAIAEALELFDVADGLPAPLPDICELDGVVYSSHPTAVRADGDGVRARAPARGRRRVDGRRRPSPST